MSSSYVNITNMVRKDITQKLQKEKAILDHIWQWKETPENSGKPLTVKNYDDCMLASGKAGEALELRLAGAKGQLLRGNNLGKQGCSHPFWLYFKR